MRYRDIEALLLSMGFCYSRCNGSHRVYIHPEGRRPVLLIHNSKNNTFGPKLVSRIIKEAETSITEGKELRAKRA